MIQTYTDALTYASLRHHDGVIPSKQTTCRIHNIYVNIPVPSTDIPKEITYATLLNTTSNINRVRYEHIAALDENNNNRVYENVKTPRPPSVPIIPLQSHLETGSDIVLPSSHVYINLQNHEDTPPMIPARVHPPKDNQKEDMQDVPISPDFETSSNVSTIQTVKQLEVNMAPSYSDKSNLYRTKMSTIVKQMNPSFTNTRQRRTLHRTRRRSSLVFRSSTRGSSNSMRRQQQQQQQRFNLNTADDRSRRILHKKSPIKSDRYVRGVSNEIYNETEQQISFNHQSNEEETYISEHAIQFNETTQDQVVPWYENGNNNEQVFSTSENEESDQQDSTTNEVEEEEFFTHEKFEDFHLRRRRRSSCSSATSVTNTVVSETVYTQSSVRKAPPNHRRPGVALGLAKTDVDFIHNILQRTHGDHRVSNRITALKEAYVRAETKKIDLVKPKNVPQMNEKKKLPMKHSMSASKIRDELEKYDELPAHSRTHFNDDDDEDDDTYSANDDREFDYNSYHRARNPLPSTVHRILNFVISLKQRVQISVQHLQKNFQDFRSRILIEAMTVSSNQPRAVSRRGHDPSDLSRRHAARVKTMHNSTTITRHANSHQSSTTIEHSNHLHRRQVYRTHSNMSQLQSQHHVPSFERHVLRQPHTLRMIPHQQRLQRIGSEF